MAYFCKKNEPERSGLYSDLDNMNVKSPKNLFHFTIAIFLQKLYT